MASIENVLAGASAGDYFAAAFYYQSNGDINKARTYIDKALEMSAENHFFFYARDH
jgi:Tfp pilus assembly protein PilF